MDNLSIKSGHTVKTVNSTVSSSARLKRQKEYQSLFSPKPTSNANKKTNKASNDSTNKNMTSSHSSILNALPINATDDADEFLVGSFSCALQKDILHHGRLYLTNRYLAFYSSILGISVTRLVIPLHDVIQVEKKYTAFLFPNAIQISSLSGGRYFFASFVSRDSAFGKICACWKRCLMDRKALGQRVQQANSSGEPLGSLGESPVDLNQVNDQPLLSKSTSTMLNQVNSMSDTSLSMPNDDNSSTKEQDSQISQTVSQQECILRDILFEAKQLSSKKDCYSLMDADDWLSEESFAEKAFERQTATSCNASQSILNGQTDGFTLKNNASLLASSLVLPPIDSHTIASNDDALSPLNGQDQTNAQSTNSSSQQPSDSIEKEDPFNPNTEPSAYSAVQNESKQTNLTVTNDQLTDSHVPWTDSRDQLTDSEQEQEEQEDTQTIDFSCFDSPADSFLSSDNHSHQKLLSTYPLKVLDRTFSLSLDRITAMLMFQGPSASHPTESHHSSIPDKDNSFFFDYLDFLGTSNIKMSSWSPLGRNQHVRVISGSLQCLPFSWLSPWIPSSLMPEWKEDFLLQQQLHSTPHQQQQQQHPNNPLCIECKLQWRSVTLSFILLLSQANDSVSSDAKNPQYCRVQVSMRKEQDCLTTFLKQQQQQKQQHCIESSSNEHIRSKAIAAVMMKWWQQSNASRSMSIAKYILIGLQRSILRRLTHTALQEITQAWYSEEQQQTIMTSTNDKLTKNHVFRECGHWRLSFRFILITVAIIIISAVFFMIALLLNRLASIKYARNKQTDNGSLPQNGSLAESLDAMRSTHGKDQWQKSIQMQDDKTWNKLKQRIPGADPKVKTFKEKGKEKGKKVDGTVGLDLFSFMQAELARLEGDIGQLLNGP